MYLELLERIMEFDKVMSKYGIEVFINDIPTPYEELANRIVDASGHMISNGHDPEVITEMLKCWVFIAADYKEFIDIHMNHKDHISIDSDVRKKALEDVMVISERISYIMNALEIPLIISKDGIKDFTYDCNNILFKMTAIKKSIEDNFYLKSGKDKECEV